MTDYAQQQWQQAPPVYVRKRGTTLSRWSVLLGIQSILFGLIIPIPVLAIVFGIVGLARGTDVPGRTEHRETTQTRGEEGIER